MFHFLKELIVSFAASWIQRMQRITKSEMKNIPAQRQQHEQYFKVRYYILQMEVTSCNSILSDSDLDERVPNKEVVVYNGVPKDTLST